MHTKAHIYSRAHTHKKISLCFIRMLLQKTSTHPNKDWCQINNLRLMSVTHWEQVKFPVQCVLICYVAWVRDDVALRRYAPDHLALKCKDSGDEIKCNFRLFKVLHGDPNCFLASPSHYIITSSCRVKHCKTCECEVWDANGSENACIHRSQVNFQAHNPKTLKPTPFVGIRIPFETTL